jgi:hypothetical protein
MSSIKFNTLKLTDVKMVTSDVITNVTGASELQKIQSSDTASPDQFGYSVSINGVGDIALIGAKQDYNVGGNAGAAYIFSKNVSDIWSQRQKLLSSDIQAGDYFGVSVAINTVGDTAIIGAGGEDTGGLNAGAAYIFTKNASDIWSQKQKIQASDRQADDFFGYPVAINGVGDIAVVGAGAEDTGGINAGAAYIFTKNASDIWSQRQKIQASDRQAYDYFGNSLVINKEGNTIIVGADREDTGGSNAGAAYIFTKNTSDIWSEKQKILSGDIQANDNFGNSVAINSNGTIALIGAKNEDTGGSNTGSVYVFTKNASDNWIQQQKIQASDRLASARFGAYTDMDLLGNTAIISANQDAAVGTNAGAAYIFTRNSSDVWSEVGKITSSDIAANDRFGSAVTIDDNGIYILVGAYLESTGGSNAGSAYAFKSTLTDVPIGEGVVYADVVINEAFRMKSDTVLKIKI